MRLLELRAPGDPPLVVPLHPRLTVVAGLSPAERALLLQALDSLRATRGTGLGGVMEAHGVLFDLTPATLDLLDVPADVDLLVRRAELLGVVEAAAPQPDTGPSGADERVLRARRALEAATTARTALERALPAGPGAPSGAVEAAARAALHRLDEAVAARRQAREAAEAALGEPAPLSPAAATPGELAGVEADLMAAEERLARLRATDTASAGPVDALRQWRDRARAQLRAAVAATAGRAELASLVADADRAGTARELADEWRAVAETPPPPIDADRVRRQIADLESEVASLEARVHPPRLGTGDRAAIDQAHDAVIVAQERVDRSLVKSRARRELEEALQVERDLLSRHGFGSYSEYLLSGAMVQGDPAADVRLAAARTELEDARAQLEAVERGAHPPEQPARSALGARVAAFLGRTDGDPLPELLAIAGAAGSVTPRLAEVLRRRGTDPGVDPLGTARAVLASPVPDLAGAEAEVARLDAELTRAEEAAAQLRAARHRAAEEAARRVAALRERRDALLAGPGQLGDGGPSWGPNVVAGPWVRVEPDRDPLAGLRHAVAAETAALAARQAAAAELGALAEPGATGHAEAAAALRAAVADEARAAQELAEAERAAGPVEAAVLDVDAVEYSLLARVTEQRGLSYAGSLPLVVDDLFGLLDDVDVVRLLERLERAADTVQLVLLSERPEVVGWVRHLPAERAAVVVVRAAA